MYTEFRKQLLISVAATGIIYYLFDPAVKIAGRVLVWLGENVSSWFTRDLYTGTARGFWESPSLMTEQLALLAFLLLLFSLTPQLLRMVREIRNEPPKSHGRLYRLVYSPGVAAFIFRPLAYLLTILSPMVVLSTFVEQSLQLNLNAMFNQQITVLETKATPLEIKQLRADWALMKARDDFEKIDAKINTLAKTYVLTLPYND